LFQDWKPKWEWKKYVECFGELVLALEFLADHGATERVSSLADWGFQAAYRLGELEVAARFLKLEENTWAERAEDEAKWKRQRIYGNQAVILQAWGRLEEALALHKKTEALCLELGNKDGLQRTYGNQALILKDWGRLEEALALLKKQEALCLELGNKAGLQASYGNQALILKDWGRYAEAIQLLQKAEALCRSLNLKRDLGYCNWQWGSVAQAQGDRETASEKYRSALEIFTALKMPLERDGVQADLDKLV